MCLIWQINLPPPSIPQFMEERIFSAKFVDLWYIVHSVQ